MQLSGRRVVAPAAALLPLAALVWLLLRAPDVAAGATPTTSWQWVPALGLDLTLRLDPLSWLLAVLVTGVGTLVLLYCRDYFADEPRAGTRTTVLLVAFAASMLLLVLADSVVVLYVGWELTTVCSFLLIGGAGRRAEERRAAVRAVVVTAGPGFAMLLGLLLLAEAAGTTRISAMVADPPSGGAVPVAVVLVLAGALAKCAQVPFHPWLPEAMVAPTPVSAYLHAAAMVKAGVYLVARFAPGFAEEPVWRPLVLGLGLATMLLGGWRALAQTDLKRLLAYGTLAQLGLLVVLVGAGSRTAALAGLTLLLAHACFKATLFTVVGIVDHRAGTRDLRELSGLARSAPVLLGASVLACASMVGLPPTVGYLAKETALEAFLEPGPGHTWVLVGVVLGTVLTVAYTVRFLRGAFGGGGPATGLEPASPWFALAPVVLALAGVLLGLVPTRLDHLLGRSADQLPGPTFHLALWHGVGPALLLSVLTLVLGAALPALLRRALGSGPRATSRTTAAQDRLAAAVLAGSARATHRTHARPLPQHLAVTALALALLVGLPLLPLLDRAPVRAWDSPWQAGLAAAVVVSLLAAVLVRERLAAAVVVSCVGFLVAGLFAVQGAPDLALAQLLVETVTFVVLVLVVRRTRGRLPRTGGAEGAARAAVSVVFGAAMAAATYVVSTRHAPSRAMEGYLEKSSEEGGPNAVNVIITEFRSLDTVGEVSVLVVAATAVASLVLASTRMGGSPRPDRTTDGTSEREEATRG